MLDAKTTLPPSHATTLHAATYNIAFSIMYIMQLGGATHMSNHTNKQVLHQSTTRACNYATSTCTQKVFYTKDATGNYLVCTTSCMRCARAVLNSLPLCGSFQTGLLPAWLSGPAHINAHKQFWLWLKLVAVLHPSGKLTQSSLIHSSDAH